MKTWRPRLADSLIALAVFALALTGTFSLAAYYVGPGKTVDALGLVLIACSSLPLAWRYSAPRLVLWITMVSWMAYVGLGYIDATVIFGLVIAMYSVALYLPRRKALFHAGTALGLIGAWTVLGILSQEGVNVLSLVQLGIVLTVPFAIGTADSRRAARIVELELDQQRREQAQKTVAADAVRAERARIARELHDVVAHEITVMTLQAEGARRKAGLDPATSAVLATISESGRKGLMEMQRVIGVLRATEIAAVEEAAELTGQPLEAVTGATYEPMPSLAALPRLVAQVQDAGLPVDLEILGSAHVPASVELTAYRIIQESLTNAMKYAGPGAHATVRVTRSADVVEVAVDDDGRGVISDAAQSAGGHGINGMRERVAALGGTLDTGPRTGGGFRVRAHLPVNDDQIHAHLPATGARKTAKS